MSKWIIYNTENGKVVSTGSLETVSVITRRLGYPAHLELKLEEDGVIYDNWNEYIKAKREGEFCMIYGPHYPLKKYLKVSLIEYCFLNLLWLWRKTVDEGWVNMNHERVADQLDITSRTVCSVVTSLQSKGWLMRKNKKSPLYRMSEELEEIITNVEKWQLSYSGFDSALKSESEKISDSKDQQNRKKFPVESEKISDRSIYSIYNINTIDQNEGKNFQKPEQSSNNKKIKGPVPEITHVLELLRQWIKENLGQVNFAESQQKQRIYGKLIVGLKLTDQEILRRCAVLKQLPWRRGRFTYLLSLYQELKAFSTVVEEELKERKHKENMQAHRSAGGDSDERRGERMRALEARSGSNSSGLTPVVDMQLVITTWKKSGKPITEELKKMVEDLEPSAVKRWCEKQINECV